MNIFSFFKDNIAQILADLHKQGELQSYDFSKICVDPPKDYTFGDLTTNAALVLSKAEKKSPAALAEILLPLIKKMPYVKDAQIAGIGFINIKLEIEIFHQVLSSILNDPTNYGKSQIGKNKKVNVEYVSAKIGRAHV